MDNTEACPVCGGLNFHFCSEGSTYSTEDKAIRRVVSKCLNKQGKDRL